MLLLLLSCQRKEMGVGLELAGWVNAQKMGAQNFWAYAETGKKSIWVHLLWSVN